MKQYSIFHVPFMSFYSKSLYRDVCLNWKRVCFGYLLLLVVICWIPQMMNIRSGFTDFVENDVPDMVSQIPTITIADGQASIDEPQPYMIVEPESGTVIAVIDTTGGITSLSEAAGASVLLTRTQLITKKNEFQTQVIELSDIGDMVIDQDWINHWIAIFKPLVMPIIAIFTLPFLYVSRIIQALIYGAIGLLFAKWCSSRRSYASLVRLSVVAVTPVIVVSTLLTLAKIDLPFSGLIGFAVAMGYLYFGVAACVDMEDAPSDDIPMAEAASEAPTMTQGPLIVGDESPLNNGQGTDIPRYPGGTE